MQITREFATYLNPSRKNSILLCSFLFSVSPVADFVLDASFCVALVTFALPAFIALISTAATPKVTTSIIIAAETPAVAMITPAAPVPASDAALESMELRLIPQVICSFLTTWIVNAEVAGRLKDSTVVMTKVKIAITSAFTRPALYRSANDVIMTALRRCVATITCFLSIFSTIAPAKG